MFNAAVIYFEEMGCSVVCLEQIVLRCCVLGEIGLFSCVFGANRFALLCVWGNDVLSVCLGEIVCSVVCLGKLCAQLCAWGNGVLVVPCFEKIVLRCGFICIFPKCPLPSASIPRRLH